MIVDDTRLVVGPVMLRYRSIGGAVIHAVHVYDGEEQIARHGGMRRDPTSWAFERFDVPGKREVKYGLGISVGVRFPAAGAALELASAGCDFVQWR